MTDKNKESQKENCASSCYDRAIRFCLYAIAALVPAVFSTSFYTVFSMPKLVLLRVLTAAIIVLWGCKVFVERKFSFAAGRMNVLLFVYGVVSVLTTIMTVAPFTSLYGAEGRFIGIFTVINLLLLPFFVINFIREEKTIRNFIAVNLVSAGLLAIYGLMQYFGVFSEFLRWNQDPADRVFGTVGHGNHFGAYLGMNILIGAFFLPYVKKSARRLLLVGVIVLMTVVLFMTASRGALFAVIGAFAVCGLIMAVKNGSIVKAFFRRLPVLVALGIMVLLLLGGLVTGHVQKMPLVERTAATLDFVNSGKIPDRISWWLSTLEMVRERPILGFGLSTYRDLYNAFRRTDYISPAPGDVQDLTTPEAAHNEYLNIAATQGLFGLAAFLAIVFFVFWKLDGLTLFAKKPGKDFYLALGIKGALIVYLIQVFVSFGVITTMAYFYLLLGLGAVLALKDVKFKTYDVGRARAYVMACLLVFVCCAGIYFSFREASAEYFYKQALVDSGVGNIRGAIENYQRAVLAKPGEYAYSQAFGDFALRSSVMPTLDASAQLKMLQLAEANYKNAIGINSHHPSVFHNLALAEFQLFRATGEKKYFDGGVESLKQGVALAVNNPLYPYMAGKALLSVNLDGMGLRAAEYFRKALEIRPDYRDAQQLLTQLGGGK